MRRPRWAKITRSPLVSMVGRQGKSIGDRVVAVWPSGAWWRWQIYDRVTGDSGGGGLEGTEKQAKITGSKMLAEVSR